MIEIYRGYVYKDMYVQTKLKGQKPHCAKLNI